MLREGLRRLCEADAGIAALIEARFDAVCAALERYADEIERFNGVYGLVSCRSRDELITRHILDSLAPLGIILRTASGGVQDERALDFADVGSGAGLPGIPLAIVLPRAHITLVERMRRRAGFLCSVQALLGLSNCVIEESSVEQLAGDFDIVVCRALSPVSGALFSALRRRIRRGGCLAVYKGTRRKTLEDLRRLGIDEREITLISYTTPFLDEERTLLTMYSLMLDDVTPQR